MLLRRVSEHLKAQNWTAVFLDFLIVIVGVFIGIQVANWNDARGERALERVYLERLHDEALAGINGFLETTDAEWTRRRDAMQSAYQIIASDTPEETSLTRAQCNALANTHTIIAFPHQFPSLEELNSSGRFSIIRDAEVRDALTAYALMQKNSQSLVDYFTLDAFVMPRQFPAYFQSRLRYPEGTWADEKEATCRLDLMREDPFFQNSLTEAVSHFNGYYNLVLRPEIDSVKTIRALLDERLAIDHGDG